MSRGQELVIFAHSRIWKSIKKKDFEDIVNDTGVAKAVRAADA